MIKVQLDDQENKTMEELRAKLALLGFGVTYMGGTMTLRWAGKQVTFIPDRFVLPESKDECYLCGGKDQLMPAKVTVEQDFGADPVIYERKTCTWCRCPQ